MPTLPTEQISAVQAASLDILLGLTNKTLDGLQKLVQLNLQSTTRTLAETQENTRRAFAAKDLGELLALQASLIEPTVEQAQSYRRQLFEIASATQAAYTKVAEAQYEANKHKLQDFVDHASKSAPAGSEGAVAAWQAAVVATTNLFESMQQVAKQAINVGENNLNIVATAAANASQRATAQGKRTTRQ